MRILLAVFFGLTVSTGALAFDGPKAADAYNDVRGECRIGETIDGRRLNSEQQAQQCVILDALGFQLKANGWCWDKGEVVWRRCK